MSEPGSENVRAGLRRWAKQRIEAGEKEQLLVRPGARGAAKVSAATPKGGVSKAAVSKAAAPKAAAPKAAVPEAAVPVPAAARTEPLRGDTLDKVAAEVHACKKCPLHKTRNKAVPGVGPANAGLVFIGEGPGAEEDLRGEPFVGAAGQLLNKIMSAVQFERRDVYITNIVKCRPPENRDPEPEEVKACEPYLKRQLALLRPKVICALGRHAGSWLAGAPETMGALRTGERYYEGIRVFPTYHPAALLRNPQWKRPVWEDIQKVRAAYDQDSGTP